MGSATQEFLRTENHQASNKDIPKSASTTLTSLNHHKQSKLHVNLRRPSIWRQVLLLGNAGNGCRPPPSSSNAKTWHLRPHFRGYVGTRPWLCKGAPHHPIQWTCQTTRRHQSCRNTSPPRCAKEHGAIKPAGWHQCAEQLTPIQNTVDGPLQRNRARCLSRANRISSLPAPAATASKAGSKLIRCCSATPSASVRVGKRPKLQPPGRSSMEAALGRQLHQLVYVAASGEGSFAGLP